MGLSARDRRQLATILDKNRSGKFSNRAFTSVVDTDRVMILKSPIEGRQINREARYHAIGETGKPACQTNASNPFLIVSISEVEDDHDCCSHCEYLFEQAQQREREQEQEQEQEAAE